MGKLNKEIIEEIAIQIVDNLREGAIFARHTVTNNMIRAAHRLLLNNKLIRKVSKYELTEKGRRWNPKLGQMDLDLPPTRRRKKHEPD